MSGQFDLQYQYVSKASANIAHTDSLQLSQSPAEGFLRILQQHT